MTVYPQLLAHITIGLSNTSEDGYDQDGFNVNGYDKDGYDRDGTHILNKKK